MKTLTTAVLIVFCLLGTAALVFGTAPLGSPFIAQPPVVRDSPFFPPDPSGDGGCMNWNCPGDGTCTGDDCWGGPPHYAAASRVLISRKVTTDQNTKVGAQTVMIATLMNVSSISLHSEYHPSDANLKGVKK